MTCNDPPQITNYNCRISDNALQVPLFYQVGDLLFSLAPSSHHNPRAVLRARIVQRDLH